MIAIAHNGANTLYHARIFSGVIREQHMLDL